MNKRKEKIPLGRFFCLSNRWIGLFLLLCLVAPFPTIYTVLQYQKKLVKKEVKWKMIEGIDKEELVLLVFTEEQTQTQLRWEHSKEFEYDGFMYDIVEQSVKNDSIYYLCWLDHDETKLNKQLSGLVENIFGKDDKNKENKHRIVTFFKTLFQDDTDVRLKAECNEIDKQNWGYLEHFDSISLTPIPPPPELI